MDWSDWEVVKEPKSSKSIKQHGELTSSQINPNEWEIDTAQAENEPFLSKLPRNIKIGGANLARDIGNIPYDLAKSATGIPTNLMDFITRSILNPGLVNAKMPFQPSQESLEKIHIPEVNPKSFGEMGTPTTMDQIIQKGVQYSPELLLAGNALRNVLPHLTRRGASRRLQRFEQLVNQDRNINPLNINPELIEDMRQFLPDTLPYRTLIEEAQTGNPNRLFRLQSDVGKRSAQQAKWTPLSTFAEREHGREGLRSVDRLLNAMHEGFQTQGRRDVSELLGEGRNDYRRYMRFKPYRNALLTAATLYALPKNALINLAHKLINIRGH